MRTKSNDRATASPIPADAWKSATWRNAFRKALRSWFDRARRDLPWRRNRDPYRVWLSEVMLQQTQVATVVEYFHRFTAAFPTVVDLAAASEHDVLKLWEGLGYYRRARQLHRAAQVIAGDHGGRFPDDPAHVRALPGVGRYTAGAILSIAFDRPEPIVEANTVRLYSRLTAFRGDPHDRAGQEFLWSVAGELVPQREPGLFNQALMDLGALVCTPRDPLCSTCPVASLCPTNRLGLQGEIPRPKRPPKFEDVHEAAVVVRHRDGRLLLVQRGEGGRWAGMWDFPRFTLTSKKQTQPNELTRRVRDALGLDVALGAKIHSLKYGVTRFRITLEAFSATSTGGRLRPVDYAAARWVRPEQLAEFALNTSARKLARFIVETSAK